MKIAEQYARALSEAREKKGGDAVAGLMTALKRRGHTKLLSQILSAYTRILEKQQRDRTVTIRSAEALSEEGQADILRAHPLVAFIDEEHTVRTVTDRTLARGFVIETNNTRTDHSAKRQLIELYGKLVGTKV